MKRQQLKQRAEILFRVIDDSNAQTHLNDLDEKFANVKSIVHQRYERLNRAAHLHSDYDARYQSLATSFASLQSRFHQIRETESNASILLDLQVNRSSFRISRICFSFEEFSNRTSSIRR